MPKYLKCQSPKCELTRNQIEHDHLTVEFTFAVPSNFKLARSQNQVLIESMSKLGIEHLNSWIRKTSQFLN